MTETIKVKKKTSIGYFTVLINFHEKRHYLIFFIPAEIGPCGKLLRPFHHEVDEVPAAAKAAGDQEVCQDSQEPPQVDVLVLLVLLLIYDGLLFCQKENGRTRDVRPQCEN